MKAKESRKAISLPSHRHVTIGDLFLACAADEKFFNKLLLDPGKALVERQFKLPHVCLEKLEEYLKDADMLKWLKDAMKCIHKPRPTVESALLGKPCPWGTCP